MSAPIIRVIIFSTLLALLSECRVIKQDDIAHYRKKVEEMFHHAYDGYIRHAYPYDELRPLTCDGHDTWGSYSLTLIDALDMLVIMGNTSEFQRVANLIIEKMDFDDDINVSVFETNIRVVGGLISAHLFAKKGGLDLEPGWPCSGPLLRMAEDVARRLLPAFDTPTGMPYGTVNLLYGVPTGETTVTCTAGVGTFLVEFGALSKLTGDPIFEKVAMRAMKSLYKARSTINLPGNHIDVATGKWTALDSGVGGGIDSYFEYLVKGSFMFQNTELLDMYKEYLVSIEKYLKKDDWYMWAHMTKGTISLPIFTSLDCYWPGIQAMLGDVDKAMKTIHNFHQVWKQFGFLPEFYNIVKNEAYGGREGYPLRPELVEAAMYLYQATKDPYLLEIGVDMLESIEHVTKTKCGYATVQDVTSHTLENRMESFFLAETTKYLYLLFDPDNFIHNTGDHGTVIDTPNGQCIIDAGGYIFNTEAHPIDTGALYCCSAEKKEDDLELQNFHDNLDLLTLFDINESKNLVEGVKWQKIKEDHLSNIDESLRFLNVDLSDSSIVGNVLGNHQVVMTTKGEKFKVKDSKVKIETIDGFKGRVNNQNIMLKVDKSTNNKEETVSKTENEKGEENFVEVCAADGTCKKVGLELSMKKYSKEENVKDPDTAEELAQNTKPDKTAGDRPDKLGENNAIGRRKGNGARQNANGGNDDDIRINIWNQGTAGDSDSGGAEESEGDSDKINGVSDSDDEESLDVNVAVNSVGETVAEILKKSSIVVKTENPALQGTWASATVQSVSSAESSNTKVGSEKLKNVLSMIKSFTEDYLGNKGLKSMKSLHDKLRYYSLYHRQKYEDLTCTAQPFHMRFSLMGEMFITE